MGVVAVTFLAYYGVMVYSELLEPRRVGFGCEFREQGMVVTSVSPKSPAGRANLMAGDYLLAVDGSAIRTWEDWRRFVARREIGRDYRFEIERDGQRTELKLTLSRQPGDPWLRLERKRYVQFFLLLLALVLAFGRPREPAVQIGAWLLAAIATAPVFPAPEMTAIWRSLPMPLGAALWIPQITHVMLLPIFFTFFAVFPRRLFQTRWPWIIVWSPALILAAWWSPNIYNHIYHPPVAGLPSWFTFVAGLAVLAYGGGGLTALFLNYLRLTDSRDRRRMRALVAGAVIGLLPTLLFLTAMFWGSLTLSPLVWFFVSTPYKLFALACFVVFPFSLIYALVWHRVLELSASPSR